MWPKPNIGTFTSKNHKYDVFCSEARNTLSVFAKYERNPFLFTCFSCCLFSERIYFPVRLPCVFFTQYLSLFLPSSKSTRVASVKCSDFRFERRFQEGRAWLCDNAEYPTNRSARKSLNLTTTA